MKLNMPVQVGACGGAARTPSNKGPKPALRSVQQPGERVRGVGVAAPPAEAIPAANPRRMFIDLTDVEVPVPAPSKIRRRPKPARSSKCRGGAKIVRAPGARVVYLLMNKEDTHSYIGSTTDVKYRLRQHNMEVKGGAWATSLQVKKGSEWRRVLHVAGFANDAAAYRFEAEWKKANKKYTSKRDSILTRKMKGLRELIPVGAAGPFPVWGTFCDMTWDVDPEEYPEL